ncbi:MAG: proline--tRNA ligase [Planctomycetes bacterium]|nr:proline--tRNA ligase [Planctomycetota bacterium]
MTRTTEIRPVLTNVRRGDVHRWTQTLIPTAREAPADAELPSHVLLTRAGFIRKVGAGIYDYLPLAWRSLTRISQIVREEMNAAGASEMLMPVLIPLEFYKDTKRDADYGDLLFKATDRHGRTVALGPTHEEIITELMRGSITSYKQLPLNLYQIQTKFRDEFRPRAGLLRCREFIMKDAYSFTLDLEGAGGLNEQYDAMYRAYDKIFTRCGLDFTVVEAQSGPIGGSASHEFMVNAPSGEDRILRCPETGYAANVEKCEIGERAWSFQGAAAGELDKVHTPNMAGIADVVGALGVTPAQMLKTVVFSATGELSGDSPRWILAVVRGDHDVNEGKVRDAAGVSIVLADEKEARAAGFAIGYVSPRVIDSIEGSLLVVDPDAAQGSVAWATGADEFNHHVKNFNWTRDLGQKLTDPRYVKVADVRNAREGDPSPRARGATLVEQRGIEVGHIFKLGTRYTEALGASVLDENGKKVPIVMGSYGIGIQRAMASVVERWHDDAGIIWPLSVAPFEVVITQLNAKDAETIDAAGALYDALQAEGIEVLFDDRNERPGVKFKDADLIGIPYRINVGPKHLKEGKVEVVRRKTGKARLVDLQKAAKAVAESIFEERSFSSQI